MIESRQQLLADTIKNDECPDKPQCSGMCSFCFMNEICNDQTEVIRPFTEEW